jgi:hypothetical protein
VVPVAPEEEGEGGGEGRPIAGGRFAADLRGEEAEEANDGRPAADAVAKRRSGIGGKKDGLTGLAARKNAIGEGQAVAWRCRGKGRGESAGGDRL